MRQVPHNLEYKPGLTRARGKLVAHMVVALVLLGVCLLLLATNYDRNATYAGAGHDPHAHARDRIAPALGQSGPGVRNRIGPEQQCKALENITRFARSQNPDAVDKPCAIDGSHLGDVDDTGPRQSCLTSP